MSKTTCPTFRPTIEEFADFKGFIARIEGTLDDDDIGICKIIPPAGWLAENGSSDMSSLPITVEFPIKQVVSGRAGVFNVDLMELKAMNMEDFANYDKKNSHNCGNTPEERERKFWRSLGCPGAWDHPIYGADQIGTLFKDDEGGSWNINKLDSIVNLLGPVPGVSSPYLYVGTWRSMFAYHVEDLNLYSINYLHAGASKSWYSIKQKDKKRFESMAISFFVEEHQDCHEFLRHKTKMFSPHKLREYGIEYDTVLHNEGEFIVTFPGAYHAGFNHGLNVAESTNFATPRWFSIGNKAKRCICRPHSVSINVLRLETMYIRNELRELRDVSHFHTNADMCEDSRRYRCVCATDGIFDTNDDSPPSVSCSSCTLWGHCACYEAESPFICFMCKAIEADAVASPDKDSATSDTTHLVSIGSSPNIKASPLPPATGPKKRRNLAKLCIFEISVGDIVSCADEDGDIAIGTIMDIEDDLGRLHVKGTRKDVDIWTPLSQCTQLKAKRKLQKVKEPRKNFRPKSSKSDESHKLAEIPDVSYQDPQLQIPLPITGDCLCPLLLETKQLVLEFSTGSTRQHFPEVPRTVSLLTLPCNTSSPFDSNTNEDINICEL